MDNINFKKVLDDGELFQQQENYEDNFEKINQFVVPKITDLETNKVDKVEGKGLSTNDFDNNYKQKIDIDIPAQLADIASGVGTTFFSHGKNLIDYSKTTSGFYVNQTTGAFEASATHRRTNKLICKPNQPYVFSYRNKSTGANITANVAFRYAAYDANGIFISGNLNVTSFTTPSNAAMIAISWNQSNTDANYYIQMEEGSIITTFEEYKLQILEDSLNLNVVKGDIANLQAATFKPKNILFDDNFKVSIPSYLTNSGAFTVNSGLVSPAVVGYDKQIYYNKEVCLDKEKVYVDAVLTNLASTIGVGLRSAIAGLLCEVNFSTNKLIIRNAWSDPAATVPPTVYLEKILTFTPVLNRKYSIIVEKDTRKTVSITIKDTLTGESTKLDCVEQGTTSPTNAWGGACIVAIAGSFTVSRFAFLNNQPSKPRLAIYGDSFIEGTTLVPNVQNRYAQKVKDALLGDVIIGGKGGETTSGLISKIETYSLFRPDYILLAVGLNDTVFSAYQERITTLINWCISIGATPILTTITRNASVDNLAFLQQVNAHVRGSGYKYVDFAKVLSVNYDGETQDATLFLGDGIHPNATGHDKMYQKILAEVPEIFDVY